ncbi:LuxR C-terminal-related transcriptional regulator [Adlercreutzia sp. R21]|uniref:helix-turn-helix transcriptional regulator n=1 Tax=Adlercreutzia wanghongyangiae TaxID=3111451 RepID=UPI002DB8B08D|nr:LuxR C-terminal-related transcriptional regulator [Adlercreutzia sp. R21]MEC4184007.1 LuxR C-terminal-related transcriptional regulator [Adlercreutzia sp. R21]
MTEAEERSAGAESIHGPRCAFLGLGLYQAWLSLSFYTTALFSDLEHITAMVDAVWGWGALGFALTMAMFIAPTRRVLLAWPRGRRRAPCIVAALLMALGTVATIASGWGLNDAGTAQLAAVAAMAGMFVSSAASGYLVLLWGAAFASLPAADIVGLTFGARVAGVAVFMVGSALPAPAVAVLVALLPLASGTLLFLARGHGGFSTVVMPETVQASRPRPSARLVVPLLALFVYALGGELFRQICLARESLSVDVMGWGYTVSIGVTAAVLLLVVTIYGRREASSGATLRLIRPATFFMAVAFIAFACLRVPAWLSYGVFGVGFYCMTAFAWIIAADAARRFRLSPMPVVAVSQLPTALGPCLVPLLQPVVVVLSRSDAQSLNMVAMLFSCLMFAVALFMLSARDIETVWGVFPVAGGRQANVAGEESEKAASSEVQPDGGRAPISYTERFAALAADYSLTRRETEVAELLARGRNLPYVEETLVISHGTAQTHARHIYQKMGVHTRQEFIDLVDHIIDQGK